MLSKITAQYLRSIVAAFRRGSNSGTPQVMVLEALSCVQPLTAIIGVSHDELDEYRLRHRSISNPPLVPSLLMRKRNANEPPIKIEYNTYYWRARFYRISLEICITKRERMNSSRNNVVHVRQCFE